MEEHGSTTTEQANRKLNKTEALFADLLSEDESKIPPTGIDKAKTADSQASEEEVAATPASTEPEYLDVSGFGDKKVRVKIDGVETEIPFKDVVKGYQTERYLTQKGQALAEEKKRLQEASTPSSTSHSEDDYIDPLMAKEVRDLKKELELMKETNNAVIADVMPIRYERNLSMIDAEMKAEGLTDFKEKVPEIEKVINAMPPDKAATYDTVDGFKSLYKNIKLQELVRKQASTTEKQTNPDVRSKPKVVPIESGSSPSGGAASKAAEREKAFALAKKSGDWTDYLTVYG